MAKYWRFSDLEKIILESYQPSPTGRDFLCFSTTECAVLPGQNFITEQYQTAVVI